MEKRSKRSIQFKIAMACLALLGLVACAPSNQLTKVKKMLASPTAMVVLEWHEDQEIEGESATFLSLLNEISLASDELSSKLPLAKFAVRDSDELYQIMIYDSFLTIDDQRETKTYALTEQQKESFLAYQDQLVYGEQPTAISRMLQDIQYANDQSYAIVVGSDSLERYPITSDQMVSILQKIDGEELAGEAEVKSFSFQAILSNEMETMQVSFNKKVVQVSKRGEVVHYPIDEDAFEALLIMANEVVLQSMLGEYMNLKGVGIETPPFLSEELRTLYQKAGAMYFYFNLSSLPTYYFSDFTVCRYDSADEYQRCYTKCVDSRFQTLLQLKHYLETLFTKEQASLLLESSLIRDFDGALYVIDGGRGSNAYLTSVSFELLSETPNNIQFDLIGHYDNQGTLSTKEFPMELRKTDGGWRFSKFASAY